MQQGAAAAGAGMNLLDLVKTMEPEGEQADNISLENDKVKVLLNLYIEQRQEEYRGHSEDS